MGRVRLETGDHAGAAEALDHLVGGWTGWARDWTWPSTLAQTAEIVAGLEATEHAELIADELGPYAGELVVVGAGILCLGAFDRYRGMLLGLLGRHDEAVAALTAALALEESIESPPLTARTRYWLARALLQARRALATASARPIELDRSIETAERLGMTGLALAGRELANAHDEPGVPRTRAQLDDVDPSLGRPTDVVEHDEPGDAEHRFAVEFEEPLQALGVRLQQGVPPAVCPRQCAPGRIRTCDARFRKPLTGVLSDLLRSCLTWSASVIVSLSHLWHHRLPCVGWTIGWTTRTPAAEPTGRRRRTRPVVRGARWFTSTTVSTRRIRPTLASPRTGHGGVQGDAATAGRTARMGVRCPR